MFILTKIFLKRITGLLLAGVASTAFARDPFWPLGYEHRPPEKKVEPSPIVEVKPVEPPPPVPQKRPVTPEEWSAARKLIKMTGFASAGGRQVVFLNGKSYRGGEKITMTHEGVLFTWRVEIADDRKVELVSVEAVRL
jgi:hypothetical protein